MYIKTKDNKIHRAINKERIFHYDIWYFEWQCEDGKYYEPEIIEEWEEK